MTDSDLALRLLLDEREVLRTLHQYCHAMDHGPRETFLDVFTEDAMWERTRIESTGAADAVKSFRGRSELGILFDDPTRRRAPEHYFKHLLANPRISVEGDRATVVSYFLRVDESAGGPILQAFGRYRDELVRCPDGRWRIRTRRAESESVARTAEAG